jgi:dipeptidyl aminopeptidase/acylaminoacyl peptidase
MSKLHRLRAILILVAPLPALALLLESAAIGAPSPALTHRERGNLVLEGVPPRDSALAERLQQYRHSREATFLDWLPDGAMLVATRFGEVEQVHRIAAPLGMREQLTFYPDPISTARAPHIATWSGFVFLKDQDADANTQLFYYGANSRVTQLTQGKFVHGGPLWSNDGKRVAFYGNDRNGVSYDIYVVDIGSPSAPRLVAGGQQDTWYPLDWSPDDRKLLLWKYVSGRESYLYIADVYTGTLTPVDESGHKIGIRSAKFAPDGRGLYVVSDEDGEFAQLRYIDPVSHETRRLTADIPWDIEDFDVSADGRYIAYVANEDGLSHLTVLDTTQKLEQVPAGLPGGRVRDLRFDRAGRRLALSVESPQSPRDVYVFDLNHSALERWTRSEAGPVDVSTFVPAELIRYPTWDRVNGGQRMISATLYRPRSAGPHPVLIAIHEGPESQYRAGWDPFVQFIVNELGYAVIAPNVRGSLGYGKTFVRLDDEALREDAVKDIGSLIVWIGLQPMFDREHVVAMGRAYGGYMTLATLAAYGDRLKGGVVEEGLSNFVSFLDATAPDKRDLWRAEYGDERDPKTRAYLSRISPLNNVALIRRPLLIAQGLNEPRASAADSQQIIWRLRGKGVEVWSVMAKDAGQDLQRKASEDAYLETVAMFLAKLR